MGRSREWICFSKRDMGPTLGEGVTVTSHNIKVKTKTYTYTFSVTSHQKPCQFATTGSLWLRKVKGYKQSVRSYISLYMSTFCFLHSSTNILPLRGTDRHKAVFASSSYKFLHVRQVGRRFTTSHLRAS